MKTLYYGNWGINLMIDGKIIKTLYYPITAQGPFESPKIKKQAEEWKEGKNNMETMSKRFNRKWKAYQIIWCSMPEWMFYAILHNADMRRARTKTLAVKRPDPMIQFLNVQCP